MFNKEHCSPRKDSLSDSCMSKKLLSSIAKQLNKKYKAKIKTKNVSKKKLLNEIKKYLEKEGCKNESCLMKLNFINNLSNQNKKELKSSFKPNQPKEWYKNPNTWLTTNDINEVMKQYENKYPYFKYYGATPIDFHLKMDNSCMISDLCKINIHGLKNKKCIGMVFNTDKHNQSGQHWFSMYIDLKGLNSNKPAIYYFDSAKPIKNIEEIPSEIFNLIEKLQEQNNYHFDLFFNDIKHQYGNTECGVYCLHFLTEMLKGIHFNDYIGQPLTDQKIEKYREKFFIKIL